jgi:teichuronic acid biosynthesis glycosyltransferase TuaG
LKCRKKQYGIYENITRNVASFNPLFSTCPSAYLFRMEVVKRKKLQFNIRLSSPADRYFLLELGNEKGALVKDGGKLMYRINTYSMSHHFSEKLIFDQENYFFSVIKNNLVSGNEKSNFYKKNVLSVICIVLQTKNVFSKFCIFIQISKIILPLICVV